MNRFGILTFYRSLIRHKLYAALNIGGLAVGIAVFLVLALYVRFETGFERWIPGHDRIYVVQTGSMGEGPYTGFYHESMGGLIDQLRGDFPDLEGTQLYGGDRNGSVVRDGVAVREDIGEVDANFLNLFALPTVTGDRATMLADPSSVVLTQTAARRYFGTANPVGRTLTVSFDKPASYRVTGVVADPPANSDFKFSMLTRVPRIARSPYWNHWGSTTGYTFLRFPTPAAAAAFADQLPAFVRRHGTTDLGSDMIAKFRLRLLPLAQRHLEPEGHATASERLTVATLGIVGMLVLLIAVINYVNLATARAGLRAREVAMRKVMGADRGALFRRFLGESVATVALAALLGLTLAELGLPFVNAAGGLSLTIPYGLVVPSLALLVVVVGVLAGLYPAVVLARFPAAAVLASARGPGGGRSGTRTREALVVLQFALAIAFVTGTLVLVAQTRHVRSADLGFRRDGLLIVPSLADGGLDDARRRLVLAGLRAMPGVSMVATSDAAAGGGSENNFDKLDIPGRAEGASVRRVTVGGDFFRLYRPRLLAGRLFDDAHRADDWTGTKYKDPHSIVVNRRALTALGVRSPAQAIGRHYGPAGAFTVIGVIDELRFFTPRLPDDPTFYVYYRELTPNPVASVRYTGDQRATLDAARAVWQRAAPGIPFEGAGADSRLAEYYRPDDRATRLFAIGAVLAVLIGCVGLWGLASFNTARRIKEIGIRKTLGASSAEIVRLLVFQFLRPVLLANLVAWPIAYVAMRVWLAGFDDQIALSPLYFVAATLLATAVATLTVFGQSLRASRAAPAWALRHE